MEEKLFEIEADIVTIEVRDRNTGEVYRRELPISYYENANFLRLTGEALDGSTLRVGVLHHSRFDSYARLNRKRAGF